MGRRALTISSVVWLCLAALQAPFMHVHPQDPDHHHATGLVHSHFGHSLEKHDTLDGQATWDHADEDEATVWQEWTPTVASRITIEHAVIETRLVWEPQFVCLHSSTEIVLRWHDPPDLSCSSARAPPV